ncbi:trihelix transcription factor GT-2-like [Cucurbita pepo subsp. pepo]|uniref:trihelix transcription factor GT-2-like n=1 Tax=Cucurbita pepo subsp. pepo TaxID=3664 RepID=UPI000C9D63FA|nr:trihelix transcription factor GT-2-like [Cucurbita pepo subsp. pepo]
MEVDSGEAVVAAAADEAVETHEEVSGGGGGGGGGGSNSGEEEKGLSFGGNRWPRQETLALLKIRSDMGVAFRDATHKAPLWDEVSRKLRELGFNRTPKKCKEKFENVYKYHKRTKEARGGKSNNSKKIYRFSDELEAFNHISFQSHHRQVAATPSHYDQPGKITTDTIISTMNNSLPPKPSNPLSNFPNMALNVMFSSSTSSSTASEEDPFRSRRRRRKKRKWSDFFLRLTKEVIEKQEGLQLKFLEALERIENQRKLRDEAWRIKEMKRVNQEHEVLVQEMSIAAAKDAAVVALLQKISPFPSPPPPPPPPPSTRPQDGEIRPSRWPKEEIEALIRVRTRMEMKYEENGAKGLVWEEISTAMRGFGYNRSSKRCKEKWENINKYFKKVKDSNKKRPEDAKTCPYYHQLDAIYKEKEKGMSFDINSQMEPLMVEPEQQWPPPFQVNQIMGNQEEEEEEEEESSSTEGLQSSISI